MERPVLMLPGDGLSTALQGSHGRLKKLLGAGLHDNLEPSGDMEFLQRAKQAGPQYITHPEVGATGPQRPPQLKTPGEAFRGWLPSW